MGASRALWASSTWRASGAIQRSIWPGGRATEAQMMLVALSLKTKVAFHRVNRLQWQFALYPVAPLRRLLELRLDERRQIIWQR